ncbi:MAG: glucuronate isomerase [Christensenellaceae bacterium]|jgi:glucuronate isomerase|nr:glucuronate isomerase [Christensenellaceae bacterium]
MNAGISKIESEILKTKNARAVYDCIESLPIIDYHCHLDPKEIYENKPYNDLWELWLKGDHYKWRLLGAQGVQAVSFAEKEAQTIAFIEKLRLNLGSPLRAWARLELAFFFDGLGVSDPLTELSPLQIWTKANAFIKEKKLSPRALINASNVKYIATTDDPSSDLRYHKLLQDENLGFTVAPSFRVDGLIKSKAADYGAKMDFFKENGCRFFDVGAQGFPNEESLVYSANLITAAAERGFVIQLHLGAIRNANDALFAKYGADLGCDTVDTALDISALNKLLNLITVKNNPKTIIYLLNPAYYYPVITLADAFKNVSVGVPWWFNDHKRGIEQYFEVISELSDITKVPGMLTDSRSFLSYTRHHYFRMLLANYLGQFEDLDSAIIVAKKLSYENMFSLVR